jgi:hypothetical protein
MTFPSPYPVFVSREGLDAVPRRHLPHLDGLVPAGGDDQIASRHERHAGDVVVVTQHGPHALVALVEIPQFDGHVCAARDQQLARSVESDVLDGIRVTFQGPLVLPRFEIPHLDGGVLAGRHEQAEHRMENDAGHRCPVSCRTNTQIRTTTTRADPDLGDRE